MLSPVFHCIFVKPSSFLINGHRHDPDNCRNYPDKARDDPDNDSGDPDNDRDDPNNDRCAGQACMLNNTTPVTKQHETRRGKTTALKNWRTT